MTSNPDENSQHFACLTSLSSLTIFVDKDDGSRLWGNWSNEYKERLINIFRIKKRKKKCPQKVEKTTQKSCIFMAVGRFFFSQHPDCPKPFFKFFYPTISGRIFVSKSTLRQRSNTVNRDVGTKHKRHTSSPKIGSKKSWHLCMIHLISWGLQTFWEKSIVRRGQEIHYRGSLYFVISQFVIPAISWFSFSENQLKKWTLEKFW